MSRPANVIINLDALCNNYRAIKQLSGGKVLAVVKADAYGHGARWCASALAGAADGFAVACIEEAVELRESGITQPIVLLEGFFEPCELALIEHYRLDTVIHHPYQLNILKNQPLKTSIRVWLKMDSGMGRVGFLPSDYRKTWEQLNDLPWVRDIIKMTHLACADEPQKNQTIEQLERFETYTLGLPGDRSIANSAAITCFPSARAEWNRPGLLLYGISPLPPKSTNKLSLTPVMSLRSAIISIKEIPCGSPVGYGATWVATRPSRIGIVAIGYADGYPRQAKNGTEVIIKDRTVPLAGHVSMDMLTVDLTDRPDVQMGDEVTLWGEALSVATIAENAGTIPYQLLCNLNRVPVHYISEASAIATQEPTPAAG
ncbi:Alanine racemase [invertebrate metagenome]|uniref:alanine racemase n=1 Tax=invertebrate metagenome TaxID=1711999 RepID=A0A2H9T5W3_9ZZZZ